MSDDIQNIYGVGMSVEPENKNTFLSTTMSSDIKKKLK